MGLDPVTGGIIDTIAGSALDPGDPGQNLDPANRAHAIQMLKLQQDFQRAMQRPMDFNQAMDLMGQQLNQRGLWDSGIAMDNMQNLYKDYGITPSGRAPGSTMGTTTPIASAAPATAQEPFTRPSTRSPWQGGMTRNSQLPGTMTSQQNGGMSQLSSPLSGAMNRANQGMQNNQLPGMSGQQRQPNFTRPKNRML